jgi:hypothetical protein
MKEFENYLILAASGLLVTIYKIFNLLSKNIKLNLYTIISKGLLSLIISFLIIPKGMDYFKWSIVTALCVNALINLFSEGIMVIVEKKVYKKIEEKIDKHL